MNDEKDPEEKFANIVANVLTGSIMAMLLLAIVFLCSLIVLGVSKVWGVLF